MSTTTPANHHWLRQIKNFLTKQQVLRILYHWTAVAQLISIFYHCYYVNILTFIYFVIHPQLQKRCITNLYLCSTVYIPSFFQIIPVFLEYKIPQKVTKVAIVCSGLLHITTQTVWTISQEKKPAFLHIQIQTYRARQKNNPLGKILYLWNCSKFSYQIHSVYREGLRPHIL